MDQNDVLNDVEPLVERARECQREIFEVVGDASKLLKGMTIDEYLFVPQIIFNRIGRTQWAVLALVEKHLPREAAVILTTEFEILLDLLYLSHGAGRAAKWLEHTDTHNRPWPIKSEIEDIFQDPSKKAGALSLYETLCSIKHGNPAAATFGYLVRREGKMIFVDEEDDPSRKAAISSFVVASSVYNSCLAAIKVLNLTARYVEIETKGLEKVKEHMFWASDMAKEALDAPNFPHTSGEASLATMFLTSEPD